MAVQPSTDITGLDLATRRELDNLIPTVSRMAQFGAWNELDYSADTYFALTGTWTVARVNQQAYYYSVMNGLMFLSIYVLATTTSAGMGSELYIRLPPGYAILPRVGTVGFAAWNAAAAATPGIVTAPPSTLLIPNCLQLLRDGASTAWPSASTIGMSVLAQVPVYPV